MKVSKTFRLSEEAAQILDQQDNATQFVEDLLLQNKQPISRGEALILGRLETIGLSSSGRTSGFDPGNVGSIPAEPAKTQSTAFVPRPPDPETGYPCCQQSRPCKHWKWNDIDTVWENELTGKQRGAE